MRNTPYGFDADGASVAEMLTKIVAAKSFSAMSIHVFTRIGSLFEVRVDTTVELMYDGAFEPALSELELLLSERAFGSHFFLSTSAA